MPQPTVFSKLLEEVTAADLASLIGWPESLTVEFKQDLSPRENRQQDAWHSGGKVEPHAKEKLFKEIVAIANTSGGHLVLGVVESDDKPATASSLSPLPRCADLAEALHRAAQSIDPPIPLLIAVGVPLSKDGAGVVIFRVPQSRSAPHRSTDKECYIRIGTNSVPMSMRSIQDMTLAVAKREDRVDGRFAELQSGFRDWLHRPDEGWQHFSGLCLTAVPIGAAFNLGRLAGKISADVFRDQFIIRQNGGQIAAPALHRPIITRPIVRGVRCLYGNDGEWSFAEMHSDGSVILGFKAPTTKFTLVGNASSAKGAIDGDFVMSIQWITAYAANLLLAASRLRSDAGSPECEYAVQATVACTIEGRSIDLTGWNSYGVDCVGKLNSSLTLPRLSFGEFAEANELLNIMISDVFDAAGAQHPLNSRPFEILM